MRFKVIPEQRVFVTCDGQQFLHQSEAEQHIVRNAGLCIQAIRGKMYGPAVRELLRDAGFLAAMRDFLKCADDIDLKEE